MNCVLGAPSSIGDAISVQHESVLPWLKVCIGCCEIPFLNVVHNNGLKNMTLRKKGCLTFLVVVEGRSQHHMMTFSIMTIFRIVLTAKLPCTYTMEWKEKRIQTQCTYAYTVHTSISATTKPSASTLMTPKTTFEEETRVSSGRHGMESLLEINSSVSSKER